MATTREPDGAPARAAVLDFVRTPFHVRCNMVKVWGPFPTDIWTALSQPGDRTRSHRVERRFLAGVVTMAVLLMVDFSGIGLRTTTGEESFCFPLLRRSVPVPESGPPGSGWYYWCFLFGESFFVPVAMWVRPAIHDASGQVFERHRLVALALYMTLFVVVPIIAMVQVGWPTSFRSGGHDEVRRNARTASYHPAPTFGEGGAPAY